MRKFEIFRMVQESIHTGLVYNDKLKDFTVTVDWITPDQSVARGRVHNNYEIATELAGRVTERLAKALVEGGLLEDG